MNKGKSKFEFSYAEDHISVLHYLLCALAKHCRLQTLFVYPANFLTFPRYVMCDRSNLPTFAKVQTFWEAHKNLRSLLHAFYIHLVNVQTMRKIFSNFVCFSKSPNFIRTWLYSFVFLWRTTLNWQSKLNLRKICVFLPASLLHFVLNEKKAMKIWVTGIWGFVELIFAFLFSIEIGHLVAT